MAIHRYKQYDYDFGPDGPISALQARSVNPNFRGMIAPPRGWVDLVVKLDADLAELFPNYTVFQVKEKFGGLRYYISTYGKGNIEDAATANDLISNAEHASFYICQVCGDPGQHDENNAWAATLCPKHTLEED